MWGEKRPSYVQLNQEGAAISVTTAIDLLRSGRASVPYAHAAAKKMAQSDGSLGLWAALGSKTYGVLYSDDGTWVDVPVKGAASLTLSVGKVSTYEQIRDAICNGYPVSVSSSLGFNMRPRVDRGKSWGVTFGRWDDTLTLIGLDDDDRRPGCYAVHNWGDVHGRPMDDAPLGGFWIDAEIVTKMAKMDDSWAISDTDGFPERIWSSPSSSSSP